MQKKMKIIKSHYFNNYRIFIKLLVLMILMFCYVACNTKVIKQSLTVETKEIITEHAININTATAAELEKLPNVGAKLAQEDH